MTCQPTPAQLAQVDAREHMHQAEQALCDAIVQYARATQRWFEEEGILPSDTALMFEDLGRYGKVTNV